MATPFYFNITPYLNPEGRENTIAVKAVNPGENSRWYSGSGIYREVRISVLNPVSADIWGTSISTPRVSKDKATVKLDVHINNYSNEELDNYARSFGIRSIAYSAEEGFLLNGEPFLIRGANMHHDNGLLGAAAYKDAEYRKVRIMKENGFKSINGTFSRRGLLF